MSASHSVSLVRYIRCNNPPQCVKKDTLYNDNQTLKDYASVEQTPNNLAAYCWSIADLLRGDFRQSQYGRIIFLFITKWL